MLWAALHLPDLPVQVFERSTPTQEPLLVVDARRRGVVYACNAPAADSGVGPGMRLSTARTLVPLSRECFRDPDQEATSLEEVAQWAYQYSPTISLAPPDSVLLEIAGSLSMFGGLEQLAERLRNGLDELGWKARITVAPTPGAACLLARAGGKDSIHTHATLPATIASLPIAVLADTPEHLATLQALGIHTVADCLALPRDSFARRFGSTLLDELDRALGERADPRLPYIAPTRYRSRLVLPHPVIDADQLLFAGRRLLVSLCGSLASRSAGALSIGFSLEHEDPPATRLALRLSIPSRDSQHLANLLRERLQRIKLPDRVESLSLEELEAATLAAASHSLFASREPGAEGRAELIERLCARLGDDAVTGISCHPEHRPEHAWRATGLDTRQDAASRHAAGPRPLWLLDTPRRLSAHDEQPELDGPLALLNGPERIESGWWDGADIRRDYFVAINPRQSRYWIYREAGGWFVHGLFG